MILAIAVLLIPCPADLVSNSVPQAALTAPAASADNSGDAMPLVSAKVAPVAVSTGPLPTVKTPASGPVVAATPATSAIAPGATALNIYLPPPPAFRPSTETLRRPSRAFFVMMATEHSAAGFDAWSTRQAVGQGRIEADPLMRPFAHSGAIYGAIQVVPLGLDFVAHRMQRSSGWARRVWWVPQSLATATFLFSGSYNFSHTR